MRVLLVSPGFHGYHSAIASALTARGHDVTTHVYDDHGGRAGRAWHQLRHELPRKLGAGSLRRLAQEETERAVKAVEQSRPEAVLVVKGDSLGDPFWNTLRGLPRITWLYDEVRRTRWTSERTGRHRAGRQLLGAGLHRLPISGPRLSVPAARVRPPPGVLADHAPRG